MTEQEIAAMNRAMSIDFNRILRESGLDRLFRGPRWTYYASANKANKSRTKDRYFYTTEKVRHGERLGFVSGIYRYNASKKKWKAIREVCHAKRKAASERAWRLREQNA